MMAKIPVKGTLEVICGSMFSGKSEELIRRARRSEIAHTKTIIFKHKVDDRMSVEYVHSHNGDRIKAIALDDAWDINLFITDEIKTLAIDEAQFFSSEIVQVILELLDKGKRIIAAGLDLDFRGQPFGSMPLLMALADSVTKLNAICVMCGNSAHFSQRLINGKAANFDDPLILIGMQDYYEARCRDCYFIDKNGWNITQSLND
ncbi:thymidine kinase [Candidatus Dependentiae bacterium]|nr:thymidine kinase [Candidatus Dependentiae bacterium]